LERIAEARDKGDFSAIVGVEKTLAFNLSGHGREPITLRTADRVGEILRHLDPQDRPQGRYAFYM
jgi:hypothetical protein